MYPKISNNAAVFRITRTYFRKDFEKYFIFTYFPSRNTCIKQSPILFQKVWWNMYSKITSLEFSTKYHLNTACIDSVFKNCSQSMAI